METRVGLGFDVHRLVEGRPLVLGGVSIPCDRGLAGHSDADVLTHALMDAILGALRAGDIGEHFPDTDKRWEGARSTDLLRRVVEIAEGAGYGLADADCVVVMEEPKVAPYRAEIRASLARAARVEVSQIGVKATTTEGLGATGRKEGVAAYAVVMLERRGA